MREMMSQNVQDMVFLLDMNDSLLHLRYLQCFSKKKFI